MWPDRLQELLLQAALGEGERARAAWREWQARRALDDIDDRSYRLLPLVHRNLLALGEEHPDMGRMHGVRRHTLVRNQFLFRELASALGVLRAAGIEAIAIRGAALACGAYGDAGLRPMNDGDVLVRDEDAERAAGALETAGWRRITAAPRRLNMAFRRYRSAIGFRSGGGGARVNLHWHALRCCCTARADAGFWARAERFEVQGAECLAPGRTDQLLHACVSGLERGAVPGVRWVADAAVILRQPGTLDAERICGFAAEFGLVPRVRRALEYLRDTVGAAVPATLVERLAAMPLTHGEEREYERGAAPWLRELGRRYERASYGTFAGYLGRALRWSVAPRVAGRLASVTARGHHRIDFRRAARGNGTGGEGHGGE
jgi:hypothetical protein